MQKLKKSKTILVLGLMSTLMACQTPCPTMPLAPIRPALPSLRTTLDQGIALNKEDAARLGIYILELEQGYK